MKDLFIVVPDKDTEYTLRGVLPRDKALQTRKFSFDMVVHFNRDNGVRTTGPAMANSKRSSHSHALLVLDWHGSGVERRMNLTALQNQLDAALGQVWGDAARSIVVDPEIESWVWGSDEALGQQLRWQDPESVRVWLQQNRFGLDVNGKPHHPKDAFRALLRRANVARSPAVFEQLAERLSLEHCKDRSFARLRSLLRKWYPPET